ncbi:zinc finger MYM-type protein 1-like [Asparagus officinalis]|uniref:zinc finger MYM-type protein 1-like n=1 Tax=Asparagus officinalis TaxID=4686 RepID=UPI00098E2882|nr:zinc finger MYM-type protein 1-like [Asparagus officinalis]
MLDALKKPSQNIKKHLTLQNEAEIKKNRLRVVTTINAIRWLACQGCALRGHDESLDSANRGNFIELLKYSATLNVQVAEVILENAPGNASYTSAMVQNQIMKIMGDLVRKNICEKIGDFKFCILVDESRDESNCEQMAIVLRFVDADGFIRERFFDVIGVEDTTAQTLKKMCSLILDRNGLLV